MPKVTFVPKPVTSTFPVEEEGMVNLVVESFHPKWVKAKGDEDKRPREERGINFTPYLRVVSREDGRPIQKDDKGLGARVIFNCTQIPGNSNQSVEDFSHACGLPLEGDAENGLKLPGNWTPETEDDIEKCTYRGPLVNPNRQLKAHIIKSSFNNRPRNEVKFFVCAVPNCNTRFPKTVHLKTLQFTKKNGN